MRRRSAAVERAADLLGGELGAVLARDPGPVIARLEPLVTDERRARLLGVIEARLASVTVLMDAPHDPHNGAAVARSCDAFGVQALHVIERKEPFLVAKSVSRGSEKWVDMHLWPDAAAAVAALGSSGHELVATHPDGELLPHDLASIPRLALVIGNEREGISGDLRRHAARAVRVPMRGFAESLNLSVTTAILLARATEGRPGDLPELERLRLYARGLFLTVPRAAELLVGA